MAASSSPNVDAMIALARHGEEAGQARDSTPNTMREEEGREQRHQREDGAADVLASSSDVGDSGALRSCFHSPRCRSSRMPTVS
jgi:hypothetical protein